MPSNQERRPRFCRDCYYVERWVPILWHLRRCKHPEAEVDLVDGLKQYANIERERIGGCGPNAKNWKPRW